MAQVQKITPFLWLDGCAREAAHFYVSVFRNSRIVSDITFTQGPARGSAMVAFELDGMAFTAFDGIPAFQFSPPYPSSSAATRRTKSTICGSGWEKTARRVNAAGWRTSSAFSGKLSRPFCRS